MKKYIFVNPLLFVSIIILGIITQGLATSISFFLMFIIDSVADGNMDNLITSAYMGGGIILVFYILLWGYTKLTVYYQYRSVLKLKKEVFSAILDTKISDFNQTNSAKHISTINNDIQMISGKYFGGILESTKFITNIVFSLVAMAFLSPINALLAIALSSSPLILPIILGKKLAATNSIHMKKLGILNEKVKDFLLGFEVIKTFGIEKNINEKFFESAQETEKASYDAGKASAKLGSLSGTFMIATSILTYLVAGYFVVTGRITVGAVIAIAGLNSGVAGPMQYLSINLANIRSTKDIRNGLMKSISPTDLRIRDARADFKSDIKLENLSFEYMVHEKQETASDKKSKAKIHMVPMNGKSVEEILAELGIDPSKATVLDGSDMKPDLLDSITENPEKAVEGLGIMDSLVSSDNLVLKNITYEFRSGGKYAIVGGSGSGKSTLLRILMGYYDDYSGSVAVGGYEIRDIDRESLYLSFSILHQNVFMLDDTLRNNITLYNDYSDEEYRDALTKANLLDVEARLANGSDTVLGEGGNTISGGERQRVSIARAILKGSGVMILDEATASLDNIIAHDIEKSITDMDELTCIFVTHRYSREILEKCDGILVLKDGELFEHGTFDELYNAKGYFYSLYNVLS